MIGPGFAAAAFALEAAVILAVLAALGAGLFFLGAWIF